MNKHLNTDFVCIIELLEYLHKLLISGKKINNILKNFYIKNKVKKNLNYKTIMKKY